MILNKILNKTEKITISRKHYKDYYTNFYEACSLCDDLKHHMGHCRNGRTHARNERMDKRNIWKINQ
jgi:hypothetical protein